MRTRVSALVAGGYGENAIEWEEGERVPVKTWVYNVPLCLETAYKDRKHEMTRLKGCGGFILGFWRVSLGVFWEVWVASNIHASVFGQIEC